MAECTIHTGLRAALVCLILFEPGCKPKENPVADQSPSPVRAEFPLPEQFPMVIPVKFQGMECRFILDTGCSITSLNGKYRNIFGDPVKTYISSGSLGQTSQVQAFAIPEDVMLQLGPIRIKGQVGVQDYVRLGDWVAEYDGLLGIDILGQFLVQFDFEHRCLRFLNPETPCNPEWGTSFDLEFVGGTPHLQVQLTDSISDPFMIDTACPRTHLVQDKFEALVRHYDPKTDYIKRPITKDTKEFSGTIVRWSLGPLFYDSITIVEYPRSFLGMDFLRRHSLVTLDCFHRKIYLKQKTCDVPASSDSDKMQESNPHLE